MTTFTMDQRSAEWYQARLGRLTGSVAGDMLATIKTGEAAKRRNLRVRLVLERLTQQPQEDGYTNAAMERGVEKEPAALAAYEALTGRMAWPVGFLAHDDLMAGCSPDGLIDNGEGVLEIKCLKSANHLDCLNAGDIPSEYRPQLLHNLWISGAAWCDFVAFDDRFPEPLRLVCHRFEATTEELKAYELLVRMFLAEVDKEVAALTERMRVAA